ncbi:hypothetical protein PVK06_012925 [Gossypium arboreum]|uniref:Reverse transcriptase n=1 Tax=Gossypium arboreum TaxID=29729 RepID=A0ABR0QCS1_GOSAR|nr:hypothetical protein PVK06_012925 [Gossypium arboreum]
MESAEFEDLGFEGPSFTWHKGRVSEFLDRQIENDALVNTFPNCTVTRLPTLKSDHRPLLLSLNLSLKLEGNLPKGKPFLFLEGWVHHPRVIFLKIIAPEQIGFIAGRNITDNVIFAQEVIHSMRCIPDFLRNGIMSTITGSSMHVLWNGI